MSSVFDLAIIGGGVNGCGIARDAAGRGLSVLLVEQGDLAGATSSASTKLIHGGLRYLEYYEFSLVRAALAEREILLRAAPHIVWPLRFVLPHHAGLRPRWMLRAGLFLYDHLGGRKILAPTRGVDLRADPVGSDMQTRYTHAFEYSDCWVDDARLVVLNARDAADYGADIRTRNTCISARRESDHWELHLRDVLGAERSEAARILVNAAGPWVGDVLANVTCQNSPTKIRQVKGSHIVVPRLTAHDRSYIFQNTDGRVCFAIPYEDDFTLIGTTDADFHGDPTTVAVTAEEEDYLCAAVSEYFRVPVTRTQIVWRYAGVRPLREDGATAAQQATRDYVLELDAAGGAPPLLSVFGGKITTYRRLAEAALTKLSPHIPNLKPAWTAHAHLPGGNFPQDGRVALHAQTARRYPFLPDMTLRRLLRTYGTRITDMLGDAKSIADLGQDFGAGLCEREVDYLCQTEWAVRGDDILWRRTKRGLHMSAEEIVRLTHYLTG